MKLLSDEALRESVADALLMIAAAVTAIYLEHQYATVTWCDKYSVCGVDQFALVLLFILAMVIVASIVRTRTTSKETKPVHSRVTVVIRKVGRTVLVVAALFFFVLGALMLPSPFPNLLYYQETYSKSPVSLPVQPLEFVHTVQGGAIKETYFFNVTVTLSLPNGGTYSVGTPVLMNVTLNLPFLIGQIFYVTGVDVIADGAVAFGSYSGETPFLTGEFPTSNNLTSIFVGNSSSVFSPSYARFYLFLQGYTTLSNGGTFEILRGSETLEYPTAGQFGLAISFYNHKDTKGGALFTGFTLHTPLFINIISSDTLDIQRNNSLTLGLTCFVLVFAAIEVRATTKPDERTWAQTNNGAMEEP
jgi:hypothetical protein